MNVNGSNQPSTHSHRIALVPGDGIGIEVIEQTVLVLQGLEKLSKTFSLHFTNYDWSSANFVERGEYIPDGGLEALKSQDAILFGAVGSPDVPDHVSLWGLILPIRKRLNQFVNIRPIRVLPGISSPLKKDDAKLLDWVIVRENSEGEYSGQGGITHEESGNAIATETAIFTTVGIERTMRFAFETAMSRPRKRLTMVTKSNAQRYGLVLWDSVFEKIAQDYPQVQTDKMLVDAMTVRMVLKPESLDTIVATNLHGDILSDLAAALSGSIGVAPSSNLDPTRKHPSMFEPIHGSAPDIAGQGIANPLGTFWSAVEMLKWLGEVEAGEALMTAIENVSSSGIRTRDVGGVAKTTEVTEAVIKELERNCSGKVAKF
ncbi:hypothetical protein B7463_g3134, partial [Scytalidium lignicola]